MLHNVSVAIDTIDIFKNISFEPTVGKWNCILGKSGVGKSTVLRVLAGLPVGNDGAGIITGTINTDKNAVAWMGQQDLLFPWKTVYENAVIPCAMTGTVTKSQHEKAIDLLHKVGLKDKIHVLPHTLSGGQRQRVALVRTLMFERDIVLMDEPFSALDAVTKRECQALFHTLLSGKTIIQISHDISETLTVCDTVYFMKNCENGLRKIGEMHSPAPRVFDNAEVLENTRHIWNIVEKDSADV